MVQSIPGFHTPSGDARSFTRPGFKGFQGTKTPAKFASFVSDEEKKSFLPSTPGSRPTRRSAPSAAPPSRRTVAATTW